MKQLAVLIPTYNGGARLLQSVASCAASDLAAGSYTLLVIDNCSSDGSVDLLPPLDSKGAPVRVYRNSSNLGRVGNWNRALEIAEQEGFEFAAFLFVGDTWASGSSVGDLLSLMKQSGAGLGMAPLWIQSGNGRRAREGSRISFPGPTAVIDTQVLLQRVVQTGRLPFAPLQANIYRLFPQNPLRFDTDPAKGLNTDMEATVEYLREHGGPVALVSRPFLIWKEDPQRFFSAQDPWFVMRETRASLERVAQITQIPVNWQSANAISLLTSVRELSTRLPIPARIAFLWRVLRFVQKAPGGLSFTKVLKFTLSKLLQNRSYLWVPGDGLAAVTALNPSPNTQPASRYSL